jgi:hypothetical protein
MPPWTWLTEIRIPLRSGACRDPAPRAVASTMSSAPRVSTDPVDSVTCRLTSSGCSASRILSGSASNQPS